MPAEFAGRPPTRRWERTVLTKQDEAYWIAKEDEVRPLLVDLAGCGLLVESEPRRRGWTDDPRCLARRAVAEALVRAREHLPPGHNFKVLDAWRPWRLQQACAERAEREIRQAHPDWSDAAVERHVWTMAPPARIVPRFGSHRYGGAVDLTVVDAGGAELDMGVPTGSPAAAESALLYYELRDDLAEPERRFRDRRRLLIRAMAAAGFEPFLPEFWHWSYRRDMYARA
jgi:D-alanyl-D-alanine dipeptidase